MSHSSDIQVWHIPFTTDRKVISQYERLLSGHEQSRASGMLNEHQHHQYIITHAITRLVLSDLIDTPPERIGIEPDSFGKPMVTTDENACFNLSHSGDYALLSVSSQYKNGVDIESTQQKRDILAIAKRFFSPEEHDWLMRCPTALAEALFYQLWCYKEACAKGLGTGIAEQLTEITFKAEDLTGETVITLEQQAWTVMPVIASANYKAALAVEGSKRLVSIEHWHHAV